LIEKDIHEDLLYGQVQWSPEFSTVKRLLDLGLLKRTGDQPSSFVFAPKEMGPVYSRIISNDPTLARQIQDEIQEIQSRRRAALLESLPRYDFERFLRRTERRDPEPS